MPDLSRRGILGAIICAPAIVRASSLMAIKPRLVTIGYSVAAPWDYDWRLKTPEEIVADIRQFLSTLPAHNHIPAVIPPLRYLSPAAVRTLDLTVKIS